MLVSATGGGAWVFYVTRRGHSLQRRWW